MLYSRFFTQIMFKLYPLTLKITTAPAARFKAVVNLFSLNIIPLCLNKIYSPQPELIIFKCKSKI